MRIAARGRRGSPAGAGSGRDPVADHAGHERVRIVGLLATSRPGGSPAAAGGHDRAGVASSSGATSEGLPPAGMTSIVRRSSGIAG